MSEISERETELIRWLLQQVSEKDWPDLASSKSEWEEMRVKFNACNDMLSRRVRREQLHKRQRAEHSMMTRFIIEELGQKFFQEDPRVIDLLFRRIEFIRESKHAEERKNLIPRVLAKLWNSNEQGLRTEMLHKAVESSGAKTVEEPEATSLEESASPGAIRGPMGKR